MTKRQFIQHYFLLNKYSYLFAMLCIFAVNWLQVEIPRFIQMAIDLLNQSSEAAHTALLDNVTMVVVLSIVMVFIRILSRMYSLNPGRITEAALKNDLFFRLNRLPSTFHSRFASGKLISIINNDLNGIRLFYGIGFLQLFDIVFALSLTPIWMWRISPDLTLYSVIPIALAFIVFRIGFKRLRGLWTARMHRLQDLSEQLMNYLSGIDLIKSQQMDSWVDGKIDIVNGRLLDTTMQITRIQTFIMPVLDYANNVMKVLILGLGGYYLLQQELTIGEITAFLSYSVLLALPLMHLGRIVTVFQMGMVSIDSVQRILNADLPETDNIALSPEDKAALQRATLRVTNLRYQYPLEAQPEQDGQAVPIAASNGPDSDAPWVLDGISFELTAGKKLGILGSIGSGKSTLVNCLNHHLHVAAGQIAWGDVDITQMSRQNWRHFVRTITQEPYLFSDTMIENVQFGAGKNANVRVVGDVEEVIQLSQLSDDVGRFTKGAETIVGEKGIMLSGGQKQRLSIARALLTPCDLIIMDNVLSAVDYDTERKILNGLLNRIKDQSVLIVSHRISALESMDEILVMAKGKVIARGTHKELLLSSPYYRETWELQQHESGSAA